MSSPSVSLAPADDSVTSLPAQHHIVESDKGLIILVPRPNHKRISPGHIATRGHEFERLADIPQPPGSEIAGGALEAVRGTP